MSQRMKNQASEMKKQSIAMEVNRITRKRAVRLAVDFFELYRKFL